MQKNKLLVLFFIPFLAGIILALFCQNMELDVFTVMTEEACKNVVRMQWEYPRLFLRCLIKRIFPAVLLPALIAGGAGMWVVMLFFVWFSLSMGAVMEILALQYGLLGILLFVLGIFPQYFFYLFAYVMLIHCCERMKKKICKAVQQIAVR